MHLALNLQGRHTRDRGKGTTERSWLCNILLWHTGLAILVFPLVLCARREIKVVAV